MRQADLLEPIELDKRLQRLELHLGQVCAVAGVTKMQLDYWTTKAAIRTSGRKQRVYDMQALELVMLIKQAKDKGLNLQAAIAAAREFQARAGAATAAPVVDDLDRPQLLGGHVRVDHVQPQAGT
ncbi:MAG: MerR family transcriptional regulator [Gaiellales bacterium]